MLTVLYHIFKKHSSDVYDVLYTNISVVHCSLSKKRLLTLYDQISTDSTMWLLWELWLNCWGKGLVHQQVCVHVGGPVWQQKVLMVSFAFQEQLNWFQSRVCFCLQGLSGDLCVSVQTHCSMPWVLLTHSLYTRTRTHTHRTLTVMKVLLRPWPHGTCIYTKEH